MWFSLFWTCFNPCSAGIRSGRRTSKLYFKMIFCFNPCSAGIRSGSVLFGIRYFFGNGFQSLFCWNQVWEHGFVLLAVNLYKFQSLFCWNQVWETRFTSPFSNGKGVSILVLLESGLGGWKIYFVFFWSSLFQSLFCWNQVWEIIFFWTEKATFSVSILVLLESGLGESFENLDGFRSSSFQSLFCWNQVWEFESEVSQNNRTQRFNPCSAGIRSGSRIWKRKKISEVRFQSLFCWNQVWEPSQSLPFVQGYVVSILVLLESGLGVFCQGLSRTARSGFNPCSAGIRSGSFVLRIRVQVRFKFQSLFCWNQVWEFLRWRIWFCCCWVSILVLLESGLGVCKRFVLKRSCCLFQSLFCWNQVWESLPLAFSFF